MFEWRILQILFFGGLELFLEIWLRWGLMWNGVLYLWLMLVYIICVSVFGLLLFILIVNGNYNRFYFGKKLGYGLVMVILFFFILIMGGMNGGSNSRWVMVK